MARLYAFVAAVLIGGAGVWYVAHLRDANAALAADVAALVREARVQADIAAQAALARDVARAEAARQADKAAEYDAIRNAIEKGENDAPVPDWFIAHLGRLRHVAPR
ncbi:hypothetical protein [Defluviimonas sp. SAOS-178_SWC]|uniref:hypothetical protein n=1 Tax=Defluviimonas sp. SAOS-178_SWC TaxID=3121287 RepID=UPI003221970F